MIEDKKTRHCSFNNFIANLLSAIAAYCTHRKTYPHPVSHHSYSIRAADWSGIGVNKDINNSKIGNTPLWAYHPFELTNASSAENKLASYGLINLDEFSCLLVQMGRRVHTRYGNGYWVKRKG